MNEIVWNDNALKNLKGFPEEVKKSLGYLIYLLQLGENLYEPHSKAIPTIGRGCYELRVKGRDGIYRAFYCLKIENKILIFHTFQKKTQKTPKREIDLAKKSLKEILNEN